MHFTHNIRFFINMTILTRKEIRTERCYVIVNFFYLYVDLDYVSWSCKYSCKHFLFNIYVPILYFLFLLCTFVKHCLLCILYHLHDLLFTLMGNFWPQVCYFYMQKLRSLVNMANLDKFYTKHKKILIL